MFVYKCILLISVAVAVIIQTGKCVCVRKMTLFIHKIQLISLCYSFYSKLFKIFGLN